MLKRLLRVREGRDLEPVVRKRIRDHLPDEHFILNDHDAGCDCHLSHHSSLFPNGGVPAAGNQREGQQMFACLPKIVRSLDKEM